MSETKISIPNDNLSIRAILFAIIAIEISFNLKFNLVDYMYIENPAETVIDYSSYIAASAVNAAEASVIAAFTAKAAAEDSTEDAAKTAASAAVLAASAAVKVLRTFNEYKNIIDKKLDLSEYFKAVNKDAHNTFAGMFVNDLKICQIAIVDTNASLSKAKTLPLYANAEISSDKFVANVLSNRVANLIKSLNPDDSKRISVVNESARMIGHLLRVYHLLNNIRK